MKNRMSFQLNVRNQRVNFSPKKSGLVLFFIIGMFLSSCWDDKKMKEEPVQNINQDDLINLHKQLVKAEDLLINKYIKEQQLDVETTGSGLRYKLNKLGSGKLVEEKQLVTLRYTREVLLKDSSLTEPKLISYVVGKSNIVIPGIDEGVRLMRVGDNATFIVPPHLGYGITGEQNLEIPPKAILIYNIDVIEIH